jgi:hypothetical protein
MTTTKQDILDAAKAAGPKERAAAARKLLYGGCEDIPFVIEVLDLAIEAADDPDQKNALERYKTALTAGRRVKIGTYPAVFSTDPGISAQTVAEIEDAMGGTDDHEEDR